MTKCKGPFQEEENINAQGLVGTYGEYHPGVLRRRLPEHRQFRLIDNIVLQ